MLCCNQWEIVLSLITNMEPAADYGGGQHVRSYNSVHDPTSESLVQTDVFLREYIMYIIPDIDAIAVITPMIM